MCFKLNLNEFSSPIRISITYENEVDELDEGQTNATFMYGSF